MAQTTFKLPQGMKARTRYQNTVINIYSSGKVMFQGKNADQLASQLLPDKQSTTGKHTSSNLVNRFQLCSGDYFGPLTVCAAYVSQSHIKILKELGVDDSKTKRY